MPCHSIRLFSLENLHLNFSSGSSPLPHLRPMFHMIQTMLGKDTLQAVKNTFGAESIENFVVMVADANNMLMNTCTDFFRSEQVILEN